MHVINALDLIEKLEAKIARLYEWFSANMTGDQEAAAFFYRLSVDEVAHANLVRYQRRLVGQNMKLFADVTVDTEGVRNVITRVETLLSGSPPPVEEAVRIALDIENNAAETHYRTAIMGVATGITDVLTRLNLMDCNHHKVVEEFAAGRGYSFAPHHGEFPCATSPLPEEAAGVPDEGRPPVSPELLEKIDYYHARYERMDFYELLGVRDYAGEDMIKSAFRGRAREFHPDRLMNVAEETLKKLTDIFSRMTLAYSTLMNPDKRREYELTRTRRTRK